MGAKPVPCNPKIGLPTKDTAQVWSLCLSSTLTVFGYWLQIVEISLQFNKLLSTILLRNEPNGNHNGSSNAMRLERWTYLDSFFYSSHSCQQWCSCIPWYCSCCRRFNSCCFCSLIIRVPEFRIPKFVLRSVFSIFCVLFRYASPSLDLSRIWRYMIYSCVQYSFVSCQSRKIDFQLSSLLCIFMMASKILIANEYKKCDNPVLVMKCSSCSTHWMPYSNLSCQIHWKIYIESLCTKPEADEVLTISYEAVMLWEYRNYRKSAYISWVSWWCGARESLYVLTHLRRELFVRAIHEELYLSYLRMQLFMNVRIGCLHYLRAIAILL